MYKMLHFLQAKWISLLHHVQDSHQWLGREFEHSPFTNAPTNSNGSIITYFNCNEKDFVAPARIVRDKQWLKSMEFYTKFRYVFFLNDMYFTRMIC